jgi:hypothetical protein
MPFAPHNPYAKQGGHARAAALTATQRSEIARSGFTATTQQHFNGDPLKHIAWLIEAGLAAQDALYPARMRVWRKAAPHPQRIKEAHAATRDANGDVDFEDCRPIKEK